MTIKFFFPLALAVSLPLAACDGGSLLVELDGGAGGSYGGPSASPICGNDIYVTACKEWLQDAVPYCYAPAHHGDIGPAPFPSCVTVTGGNAPPADRNDHGWASWWCCPFHNEGDGGTVVLDSGAGGAA